MALRNCTACAEKVQAAATVCKHCGTALTPQKAKTSMIAVIGLFLFAFFILRVMWHVAEAQEDGSSRVHAAAVAAPVAAQAPPIAVEAVALWRAYDKNEVAADESYKGRRVAVTGSIVTIDKNLFDHMVVSLATRNSFESVHATLDESQKARAMTLEKGQTISVVCTVKGRIMGSPMLDDCYF